MLHKKELGVHKTTTGAVSKTVKSSVSTIDHAPYEYQRGSNASATSADKPVARAGQPKNYFSS